jgi:hypothetical protein
VSSSDPQPPAEPSGATPPSTNEIPVLKPGATATQQLPPHPNATNHAPIQPVDAPVPTGPVDFVPGLPGLGTPPPPPPVPQPPALQLPATAPGPTASDPTASGGAHAAPVDAEGSSWPESLESGTTSGGRRRKLGARHLGDRAAVAGLALVVLAVVLLQLGLTRDPGGGSYWSAVPLWSAFATVCALLGFAAFYPAGDRQRSAVAWRVAAGGLVGVAVFWLLVVLPVVDTDRGFLLTAALAALGGALWIAPRGKD